MIINSSKIKTEALLLFCRDLINSYINTQDLYDDKVQIKQFIDKKINLLLKAINTIVQPSDYYIRNQRVSRIMFIYKTYEYLNRLISKQLNKGDRFNPSMLCFAMLSTWFAELNQGNNDKEYLYFCIYPYSEIYDKLLLNLNDLEYKNLNINMLNIAENSIYKLHNYRFR